MQFGEETIQLSNNSSLENTLSKGRHVCAYLTAKVS